VLDPHDLTEAGVGPPGDVPRGHHTRRGQARLVAHHAVVQSQAGTFQPAGRGGHTDPDHDHVGVHHRAVGEAHPLHPVTSLQRLHTHAEADADPVIPVEVGGQRAQVGAQDPLHGNGKGFDHGDLVTLLATGRRHLGADEAGPDDDHPAGGGVQVGLDRETVVQRAQHVDPGQPATAG
jgi:hypothetical protein